MAELDVEAIIARTGAAMDVWRDVPYHGHPRAVSVMQASAADVPVLLAALAAAESRGRREGQQRVVDALGALSWVKSLSNPYGGDVRRLLEEIKEDT